MLTVLSGEMGETATYAERSYCWVGSDTGYVSVRRVADDGEVVHDLIPGLGKLTIRQTFRSRRERKDGTLGRATRTEIDTYVVQEFDPEHFGTRLFGLANVSDPAASEPYRVTVGGLNHCRCMAADCKHPVCKHRDAMKALLAALRAAGLPLGDGVTAGAA